MTQAKSNSLLENYRALSERDKQGVQTFLNLHNAAAFVYDGLTDDGKQYVQTCISLSQEADHIEETDGALES